MLSDFLSTAPGVLSDNEWINISSSVTEQLWHFRNTSRSTLLIRMCYTQGWRPVSSLRSWMSPSHGMIYLSAQVKRLWNVVKRYSPFLVSANPGMSILINKLEKSCFFLFSSFGNFRELVHSLSSYFPPTCIFCPEGCADFCNPHRNAGGHCKPDSSLLQVAGRDPGQWERTDDQAANNTPLTLGHRGLAMLTLTRSGEPCFLLKSCLPTEPHFPHIVTSGWS